MAKLETRKCNTCEIEKPVHQMVPSKRYRGGFMPMCRACRNQYWRDRRASNPEARKRAVEAVLRSKMLRAYGMVAADYNRMVEKQGDKCALCGTDHHGRNERYRFWNVDHNHETGKVRGLLCHTCNIAVGHIERLRKRVGSQILASYIRRGERLNVSEPRATPPIPAPA